MQGHMGNSQREAKSLAFFYFSENIILESLSA